MRASFCVRVWQSEYIRGSFYPPITWIENWFPSTLSAGWCSRAKPKKLVHVWGLHNKQNSVEVLLWSSVHVLASERLFSSVVPGYHFFFIILFNFVFKSKDKNKKDKKIDPGLKINSIKSIFCWSLADFCFDFVLISLCGRSVCNFFRSSILIYSKKKLNLGRLLKIGYEGDFE